MLDAVDEPVWQTGGAVRALVTSGGRLFAGGDFTTARPPGTAAGDAAEVVRNHLAAFSTTTGALDPDFVHSVPSRVSALAVSPDGTRLYVGGDFTAVDGRARGRVAAFDLTAPGAPLLPFNPKITSGVVRALAVSGDSVYVGGSFAAAPGGATLGIAAYGLDGTARSGWQGTVDGPVNALLVAPSGDRVLAGGAFNTADGQAHRALAGFATSDGSLTPMDPGLVGACPTPSCAEHSDVTTLETDGTRVFAGAAGTGFRVFDGTLALDPLTGQLVWRDECLGATQGVTEVGGVLYVGSHAHDCSAAGGFPQPPFLDGPATWHHLMAESAVDGRPVDWYPTTNAGPTDGRAVDELGPRAMADDGSSVFVGGQFTKVSGRPQQGLTRFTVGDDATRPTATGPITAGSPSPRSVVLRWTSASDPDDGALATRVYRDGQLLTTLSPSTAHFWTAAQGVFRDRAPLPGTHVYEVQAVDAHGGAGPRTAVRVRTATRASDAYSAEVLGDSPGRLWRLSEVYTTSAADASGHGVTGTYRAVRTQGRPGPFPGTGAVEPGPGLVSTDGATAYVPSAGSVELWFRTTTGTGGRIAGWGDSPTGTSVAYDRQLYMGDGGQLLWGVYDGGPQVVWSPQSYNDGSWHHVVATFGGPAGLTMTVDGVALGQQPGTAPVTRAASYAGAFRVGPDSLTGWPQQPSSTAFRGDVAQVAVYPQVLTPTRVRAHLRAGG